MKPVWLIFCLVIIGLHPHLYAQQETLNLPKNHTLTVYLEGEVEDFSYLRRNIKFVDFVRDPKLADVQVLATRLHLASGGRKYFLNFYSGEKREVSDFTLNFVSNPNSTDDMDRVRFSKTLQIGLLNYLSVTSTIDQINISFDAKDTELVQKTDPLKDPWNFWVIRLTAGGGWDAEESKNSFSYSASAQADRITDKLVVRNKFSNKNSTKSYTTSEDEIYRSINIQSEARSRVAYSFTEHLSVGLFVDASRSTYRNTDFSFSAKPAIEYNFFKWKDADQKIFTAAYFIGPAYYKYRDTTFLNRMEDKFLEHNLNCTFELIQPWGEVDIEFGYEGYLNEIQNYNLNAELDISVRITKGLSINFEFIAESIHNQLFLPKEEVSLEELLLNSRKLPTNFQLGGEIGLRLYFGSIYNNVVNERFR